MRYSARDLCIGGLFGALGVAVPVLFHAVGLGKTFLPMHLPVLVCGLLVSPLVAFAVGVITPVVSSALTGMPPLVPTAVLMTLELGTLAVTASVCYQLLRLPTVLAVAVALVATRAIGALELFALAPVMGLKANLSVYLTQSVLMCLPGLILQLTAAPLVMASINRAARSNSTLVYREMQ
ncbi:MAG: ECF transporter S component [Armatimonadota bacterium]|nr:ECF transporter S component [Armatimonadota bacterium]